MSSASFARVSPAASFARSGTERGILFLGGDIAYLLDAVSEDIRQRVEKVERVPEGMGVLLKIGPFIGRDRAAYNSLHFRKHHSKLRYRIFSVRWDSKTVLLIYHELMPRS
jgi:hypothetical protein